jgi:hypothetical protein
MLKETNHGFGARRTMWLFLREQVVRAGSVGSEQVRQSQAPQAAGVPRQESAAR